MQVQKHIRLSKDQAKWLEQQKAIYGSEATVIRILIDDAMKTQRDLKTNRMLADRRMKTK